MWRVLPPPRTDNMLSNWFHGLLISQEKTLTKSPTQIRLSQKRVGAPKMKTGFSPEVLAFRFRVHFLRFLGCVCIILRRAASGTPQKRQPLWAALMCDNSACGCLIAGCKRIFGCSHRWEFSLLGISHSVTHSNTLRRLRSESRGERTCSSTALVTAQLLNCIPRGSTCGHHSDVFLSLKLCPSVGSGEIG